MAENAPTSEAAANPSSDSTRGMPYYEKLRRDLRDALARKRNLDDILGRIEDSIYRAETSYLEETSAGNIIKGFDNYIKGSTGGAGNVSAGPRRKAQINDADRIFSHSSQSFLNQDSGLPTSTATTPSHAPTPTSSFPSARESNQPTPASAASKAPSNKKKRPADKDDDDTDSKTSTKRGKITYGRD
ncbi:NuA4-domain-containing protein [Saccharata proteae CBS 121410]|uniref:Chromatin modification-related protein EAF6 n=1 Tax=Saccharata proteae CBS 121410 TaxID=1314787 RepID=A0A9P4HU88_9PEZI|nr:NuA4-domain-containing protein [Saccharata proteae CBS 121410]